MTQRTVLALVLVFTALLLPAGSAQVRSFQEGSVELELGLQGAVVAGAWNPLRLVMRDLPPLELELQVDQGSLRSGPVMKTFATAMSASSGVRVVEEDIFVPTWRSLTWTVRSADRLIASGSLDPRSADERPLILILSSSPARWLSSLPSDFRLHEVTPSALPARAAAYSGVRALVIDGTASAPPLEAVVTAAAAGATVVLAGALPGSHGDLIQLAEDGSRRLGAGWLVRSGVDEVPEALAEYAGFPYPAMAAELAQAEHRPLTAELPRTYVVAAAGIYSLIVITLLRFGGSAGVSAAFVVAMLAGAAGWTYLRPERPLLEESRTLVVSSGGLGVSLGSTALRSLPGGEVRLDGSMRLLEPVPHAVSSDSVRLPLRRGQRELLLGRPELIASAVEWLDGSLVNRGSLWLQDVVVVGLGPQAPMAPGDALQPVVSEERGFSPDYSLLLAHLPEGAVLARQGDDTVHVALPSPGGSS